ncbi:MAG: hypothetical protein AB7P76_13065 [Candidatus Melainabacteria bacterium]
MSAGPDAMAKQFFQSLAQYQFPVCWNLFSSKTQQTFLEWSLQRIYQRHEKAARESKMGLPEVKFMFETNDQSLIQLFWRHFVRKCGAEEICRYGYFEVSELSGGTARVEIRLVYPDGSQKRLFITMVKNRGGWKFGYTESGFPF